MDVLFKKREWLLPVALILFLPAMILVPFAAVPTYAGRSEVPGHTLTYTTGNLVWDSGTDVDAQTGVAELSLFNSTYQSVKAGDGDKVVAPGTEGKNIVRLKNDADNSVSYIAVMYRMKEADTLPVQPVLADDTAFTDTGNYPLPSGVTQEQVVRAVTGTVGAKELQDFDITWLWEYYQSEERDQMDTTLGNKAAWDTADDVTAGWYLVVEDNDSPTNSPSNTPEDPYTYPEVPKTGDSSHLEFYLLLMAISGVLLLLFLLDSRKEKKCRKS